MFESPHPISRNLPHWRCIVLRAVSREKTKLRRRNKSPGGLFRRRCLVFKPVFRNKNLSPAARIDFSGNFRRRSGLVLEPAFWKNIITDEEIHLPKHLFTWRCLVLKTGFAVKT